MGKSLKQKSRRPTCTDEILGRTLRALRLRAGLSQQDVAWQLGVSYQQMQKYETGKSRVSVSCLVQLRRVYGVSFDMLVERLDPLYRAADGRSILPEDKLSADIFRKVDALDEGLKRKINRIVDILAS